MRHLLLIVCLTFGASAQNPQGLASKYPNDVGLAKDPAVLFSDDFESDDLQTRWDQKRGPLSLTTDRPHSGQRSIAMPMHRGKDHGADLVKWFMPGADTVHVRFYVRFSPDYTYSHHFVHLLANLKSNRWSAFGKAGMKPDGTYYTTAMEPWFAWGKNPPPGELSMYTYYLDMKPDPKMNKYWGNSFFPPGPGQGKAGSDKRVIPKLDQWQCWEFMLQANSAPDRADGKQAMWLDGQLVGEFTGIRWRNDMTLKVNCLWLQHYGYDDSDPTKQYWRDSQCVWFDDVVVATQYIGPRRTR